MSLEEKVKAVEQVFNNLDVEILAFQGWSGLQCPAGCGKCCFKPDIEATVLEFLPFALYAYKNGKALDLHSRLQRSDSALCVILKPSQAGQGLCSEYRHRGLICRLFGYAARINKYEVKELVTCEIIKAEDTYSEASERVKSGEQSVPVMSRYYMKLHAIDMDLTRSFYPINLAIKKALETVLQYYAYRTDS